MLIRESTGDVLDSLHKRVPRVEIYFKLGLIFREFLAVVVKPMLKQLLPVRVTWSSVLKLRQSSLHRLCGLKKQSSFLPASAFFFFFFSKKQV